MSLLDDLRTALRSLRRRPGFAAVVVLILAVALGANTAVFSALQQVLLRPLPYPGAEDAVYVFREDPGGTFQVSPMLEQVRRWRESASSFTAVEAFEGTRVTLLGHGAPRRLAAARVTPGLFGFLGVSPALGRGFEPGAGDERSAVLSHALWGELFGADPAALGEAVRLGDEVYTVIGVMPKRFRFVPPVEAELWLPFPEGAEKLHSAIALARLAPGVAPEAADAELAALERAAASERAGTDPDQVWLPRIRDLAFLFGNLGRAVLILQAAVALMLVIACANVGNLFLVRAEGRNREIAVRAALGARRGRLVRALFLESLLLGGAAALGGLLLAAWGGRAVAALSADGWVELEGLRLDPGLFAFTAAAGLLAAVAFGLLPALTASRADLGEVLKTGGRGATAAGGSASGERTRAALVVAEVALALVLLVGAGLLTKSFVGLVTTDPGFDPEGLLTVSVELPRERYTEEEQHEAFVRELRTALAASGLDRAVLATGAPTEASIHLGRGLRVEGRPPLPEGLGGVMPFLAVDPGYFRILGIPILEGRAFTEGDVPRGEAEERPVVINLALARALWPDGDALGGRLKLGTSDDEPWSRVVGIVGPVAQLGLGSGLDTFQIYLPLRRASQMSVLVRAGDVEPALVQERVGALVRAIDPRVPVARAERVKDLLGGSVARERFQAALMVAFAGIALVLTVVGLYSVLAYAVRRRAFEIGVRAALGARPGQVLGLVARRGAILVAVGLAAGLVASLALGRLVESQLRGVAANDPAVLAAAAGLLAAATALATLLPALRAARLDPARVLREE
jgi:predicted permease